MSKIFHLDDLHTAFPRPDSLRGEITFVSGDTLAFTTNMRENEFTREVSGKRYRLCYYGKDKSARITQVAKISFDTRPVRC